MPWEILLATAVTTTVMALIDRAMWRAAGRAWPKPFVTFGLVALQVAGFGLVVWSFTDVRVGGWASAITGALLLSAQIARAAWLRVQLRRIDRLCSEAAVRETRARAIGALDALLLPEGRTTPSATLRSLVLYSAARLDAVGETREAERILTATPGRLLPPAEHGARVVWLAQLRITLRDLDGARAALAEHEPKGDDPVFDELHRSAHASILTREGEHAEARARADAALARSLPEVVRASWLIVRAHALAGTADTQGARVSLLEARQLAGELVVARVAQSGGPAASIAAAITAGRNDPFRG